MNGVVFQTSATMITKNEPPARGQRRRVEVEQADREARRRIEREPPRECAATTVTAPYGHRAPRRGSPCGRRSPGTSPRDQHAEHELERDRDDGDEQRVRRGRVHQVLDAARST